MAKKYLSLNEAAEKLGINVDDLKRRREAGDIRGFSDRGNWKFKPEDVEEFSRQLQADSDPSVPILDSGIGIGLEDSSIDPDRKRDSSTVLGIEDSEVLGGSAIDDDTVGEQATIIRKADDGALADAGSDSDVRLVLDESLTADTVADVAAISESDSDSDVRLVEETEKSGDSDSDVKLVGDESHSDVKLVGDTSHSDVQLVSTESDSDSDVQLVSTESDSDSDVKLVDTESDSDSDVQLVGAGTDSDVALVGEPSEPGSDSDVKLIGADAGTDTDIPLAAESSDSEEISVFADDSGISLAEDDSGISLVVDDSGIALESADDSGISLVAEEDSGLSLAAEVDSGISLSNPTDSGIALEALLGSDESASGHTTIPLTEGAHAAGDMDATQLDMPARGDDEDSSYELSDQMSADSSGSDTGVIVFDDDEDALDDHAATMVKKSGAVQDEFDISEGESFDFDDSEEFGDDLDVVDDVMGEDDELDDMDVFDAGDEDFADSFAGASEAEFITPSLPAGQLAIPVEVDWGIGTFLGLTLASVTMVFCSLVMFDYVRSMWSWSEPTGFSSTIMKTLGGMFKK